MLHGCPTPENPSLDVSGINFLEAGNGVTGPSSDSTSDESSSSSS